MRTERFVGLIFGALVVCYVITWLSMMGYFCSVLSFMKLTNDASQPITNGVFGALPFVVVISLHLYGETIRSALGVTIGAWAIAAVGTIASSYANYMVALQLKLTNKLRAAIWDHIVWE